VGGVHVGGATDLLDAYRKGRLQELLEQAGVAFNRDLQLDPFSLLPQWLHRR